MSYEGVFAATDGAAAGMTSVDIGVQEATTAPVGYSLQLTGAGSSYGEFTWAGSAAHTRGLPNNSQTLGTPPTPSPTPSPSPVPSPTPALTIVTFTSVAAADGWVLEKSETSSTGGSYSATATVISVGDDAKDRAYRGVLSFDTSSLPDAATVVRATVKFTRTSITGTSPFQTHGSCVVDIRSPYLGTSASLATADWQAAVSASAVATLPEPTANGQQVAVDLSAGGLSYVNRTGTTQFKLRFTVEDNDDLSSDFINFASSNHGTASYRPVLEVEY